jgi:hypothetical protein
MRRQNQGRWYLITGLFIGIIVGLIFAWVISPIEYVDTEPASLREDFKEQYRSLIAASFAANSNLARAQARLELLDDPNISDTLAAQAQRALAAGHPQEEVRALGLLASVADEPLASIPTAVPLTIFPTNTSSTETSIPSPSATQNIAATATPPHTPTLSPTLTPTKEITITNPPNLSPTTTLQATPRSSLTHTPSPTFPPTATLTPTTGSPFVLDRRNLICDPLLGGPLLIIQTSESNGTAIPGVEIIVNWTEGEEHFFTGLKPELGLGYADFLMTPNIIYTLRLADGSQLITDLTAAECQTENGDMIWGSWELLFKQP